MRRRHYGPLEWSLVPPPPGTAKKFQRWNLVLIAFLLFLVLGVFVVAEAPTTGGGAPSSANASFKNENPASLHHAKSIQENQPGIHEHGGGSYLNKDLKASHHTS